MNHALILTTVKVLQGGLGTEEQELKFWGFLGT